MEHQDFTDAAMIALNKYLSELKNAINEKLPEKIGKIETGMGGEWSSALTEGRVLYATPFYEMEEGLPINLDDDNGNTIKTTQLPFEITGNLQKDAESYILIIGIFLSMVD